VSKKVFVCRCEDVTLADLQEAIAHGHRDIESAKRYTGFGTGWCQGKQCAVLCAQVIEAATGVVPDGPFTPRPPFHPVPLSHLARVTVDE